MSACIPDRTSSKYCRHYAGAFDAQRVVEIFTDSNRIALSSKKPDTATDRFALAVEAYHQLMSMGLRSDVHDSQSTMQSLADDFPARVVVNEALGLCEKARKLKTPRKQMELLHRARQIVERGIAALPGNAELASADAELRREMAQAEATAQ